MASPDTRVQARAQRESERGSFRELERTLPTRQQLPQEGLRAMVVGSAPLDESGGVEACCREVISALDANGFSSEYLSGREQVGSQLKRVPGRRLWSSMAEAGLAATSARALPDADLVISNGPIGWGIRGRRSVHYYHGTYAGQAEAVRKSVRRRGYLKLKYLDSMSLERMAGRGKLCLANSERTAQEVAHYFGYDCRVVWCPVDTAKFMPGTPDEELKHLLGIKDKRPVGLYIGADRPMKGPAVALEVMRRTPDVNWVAVGSARLSELDTQFLAPRLPSVDMPALYRSVDLLLMTSVYEPFGLVVAEALCSGTPVVAGPTGAGDLLMANGALRHYVVDDPLDELSFVNRVRDVLIDPIKARQAALQGRTKVVNELGSQTWGRRFVRTVWS
jgi:glycosyltransferase involved in cell wall biosynthesis